MMKPIEYAEDFGNYWKTSQKSPDTWIEDAKKLIISIGGKFQLEMFGADGAGRAAFMLGFTVGNEQYKITWPVLKTRKASDAGAARRQAATLLYHDVKHKVMMAKIKGVRAAFTENLLLPTGQTAGEVNVEELTKLIPAVFMVGAGN